MSVSTASGRSRPEVTSPTDSATMVYPRCSIHVSGPFLPLTCYMRFFSSLLRRFLIAAARGHAKPKYYRCLIVSPRFAVGVEYARLV
jgi:hypothetical protein